MFILRKGRFIWLKIQGKITEEVQYLLNRIQTYNSKTDTWIKRDTNTGRFMDQKTFDNKTFKGVRKE